MTRCCLLDLLPVELLHTLFTYFLAHEILFSFSDVSNYINAVLFSYASYRLNFISIRESDFEVVCHRIYPNQVISLTLSDDNDTPGLSKLFLSHFQIEQFIQLQSLKLIQIEIDSLKMIVSNLHKLNQLRSISFDIETIRHRYPPWNNDYSNESYRLKSLLLETYTRVLPQLHCICLNDSTDLVLISLPHLRHLKLSKFSIAELEIIFQNSQQLKSLHLCLYMNRADLEFILPVNQLIRLNLKIENRLISTNEIKRLFSNSPNLKYLELNISVWTDVVDGHFWQVLTSSLLTFNFKFNKLHIRIDEILDSYRTPFWLEEKRWFVAYQNDSFFSIPYFAPVHVDWLNLPYFYSTAPDHSFIYQHLNKVTVGGFPPNNCQRLTHVKTLELECSISSDRLESGIDLNQVERLIVLSLDNLLMLIPLECSMPRLNKLIVKNSIAIDMIERIKCYRFQQIRTLQIRVNKTDMDYIIEELFRIFPYIDSLIYKSSIESVVMMVRLINGFKSLLNASFLADYSFRQKEDNFCRNPNSNVQYLQRYTRDNVTCQVYYSINTQLPVSIHCEIKKQPSTRLSIMKWSWRRGYYWYRLKYSF